MTREELLKEIDIQFPNMVLISVERASEISKQKYKLLADNDELLNAYTAIKNERDELQRQWWEKYHEIEELQKGKSAVVKQWQELLDEKIKLKEKLSLSENSMSALLNDRMIKALLEFPSEPTTAIGKSTMDRLRELKLVLEKIQGEK
jgi:transcription initiation factor TFIID subunit TAF12